MKSNIRFTNELTRIVQGALRLDIDKVRNYTNFLADNLEKEGDSTLAKRLRKLLEESDTQLRPVDATFESALPVDSESRFPLIEAITSDPKEAPLVLASEQWNVIHEFASVAKSYSQFDTPELSGALSLLVYGPPGTGKNRLARHLSNELGLNLYIARLDGLISSYLGSTSKNIRALFEFTARRPCLLFLDEFDAIAKLRGDSQELGELKRVVNSFLQNLDTIGLQSIVIAATNHEELLDRAIWRRFSYRIALQLPDRDMRHELWVQFIKPLRTTRQQVELLVDLTDGLSGSDIREVCVRLNRHALSTKYPPTLNKMFTTILNMAIGEGITERIASTLRNLGPKAAASRLRSRDCRLYSLSALAHLFDVSKSTVHRWLSEEQSSHG